jgi:hypothetical protein
MDLINTVFEMTDLSLSFFYAFWIFFYLFDFFFLYIFLIELFHFMRPIFCVFEIDTVVDIHGHSVDVGFFYAGLTFLGFQITFYGFYLVY